MAAFTNENGRFKTDTTKGCAHGTSPVRGSVFPGPIRGKQGTDYTLWLEHVISSDNEQLYWFQWYSPSGTSTTKTSAVFDKDDLKNVISQLVLVPDA